MTTELANAKQCYTAWKDRCHQVEERLAIAETRLQDYRRWHDENKDMVTFGKQELDKMQKRGIQASNVQATSLSDDGDDDDEEDEEEEELGISSVSSAKESTTFEMRGQSHTTKTTERPLPPGRGRSPQRSGAQSATHASCILLFARVNAIRRTVPTLFVS